MRFICVVAFAAILTTSNSREVDIMSNILESTNSAIKIIEADVLLIDYKIKLRHERVSIQLYYECMCPHCRQFDSTEFLRVYANLAEYLDVRTFPYGNARTVVHDNGTVDFTCQHGPEECYGNKLHACAINIINNITDSILFNACMMDYSNEGRGSDDRAADRCGGIHRIDADAIKHCAKSQKGVELLKYYGEQSRKVNYKHVPYVLINGVEWNRDKDTDFMKVVCAAFIVAPSACNIYD